MAMQYREVQQRFPEEAAKYPTGVKLVDRFVESLQKEGLLPERFLNPSASPENPDVKSPEVPVKIKTFSIEALDFLKSKKQLVYPLNGLSLRAQRLADRPFWYMVDAGEQFLNLASMYSQVAINPSPDEFFLPESNKLTLVQQQEIIDDYSYKLQIEFGSEEIKAVMGDAPDYTLLAFLHLDAMGGKDPLFGKKYGYNYARTKTPTSDFDVARVGYFRENYGLHIFDWPRDLGLDHVHAAPLVVPV